MKDRQCRSTQSPEQKSERGGVPVPRVRRRWEACSFWGEHAWPQPSCLFFQLSLRPAAHTRMHTQAHPRNHVHTCRDPHVHTFMHTHTRMCVEHLCASPRPGEPVKRQSDPGDDAELEGTGFWAQHRAPGAGHSWMLTPCRLPALGVPGGPRRSWPLQEAASWMPGPGKAGGALDRGAPRAHRGCFTGGASCTHDRGAPGSTCLSSRGHTSECASGNKERESESVRPGGRGVKPGHRVDSRLRDPQKHAHLWTSLQRRMLCTEPRTALVNSRRSHRSGGWMWDQGQRPVLVTEPSCCVHVRQKEQVSLVQGHQFHPRGPHRQTPSRQG